MWNKLGMRAIEKLAELTKFPDLSKEDGNGFENTVAISVTQRSKNAVSAGIIVHCLA